MKKIKYLLVLLTLVFSLVGCSQATFDGAGSGENAPNNSTIETTRKIYYTVNYSIFSTDYHELKNKIDIQIININGYIEKSNENESYACIIYRVPTEELNSFLDFVDSFGDNVHSKSIESTDVTSSYSSLEARKEVLEASRIAYVEMLKEENISMSNIIALQDKINAIDIELLSITKELAYYDNLLDYSKVTINFNKEYKESFINEYLNYLSTLFTFIGKAILYILPIALIGGSITFVILFVEKKKNRK